MNSIQEDNEKDLISNFVIVIFYLRENRFTDHAN